MFVKSLTLAAFILGLGVVAGCDDPEVQSRVASVMEHGMVDAELVCSIYNNSLPHGFSGYPGHNKYDYKATKLIDGSCYATFCPYSVNQEHEGASAGECYSTFSGRAMEEGDKCEVIFPMSVFTDTATYPYRPFKDGIFASVEDGLLSIGVKDARLVPGHLCGNPSTACYDPLVWFSYDITDSSCTGRNLEAFGVTP